MEFLMSGYGVALGILLIIIIRIRQSSIIEKNRQIDPDIRDFFEVPLYREIANVYREAPMVQTNEQLFRYALLDSCGGLHSDNTKRAERIRRLWRFTQPQNVQSLREMLHFIDDNILTFKFEYLRDQYSDLLKALSSNPNSLEILEQTRVAGTDFVKIAESMGLDHINQLRIDEEIDKSLMGTDTLPK